MMQKSVRWVRVESNRVICVAGLMPFPSVLVVQLTLILGAVSLVSPHLDGTDVQVEGLVLSCTPSPLPVSLFLSPQNKEITKKYQELMKIENCYLTKKHFQQFYYKSEQDFSKYP